MDFYGFSGLDLDAPKRAPEDLDPKKRMLGLTPAVVFMVFDVPKTHHAFGDPLKYICLWRPPRYECVCVPHEQVFGDPLNTP